MSATKTCMLMLEALEPTLLRAGMARGELPNLEKLCASGCHGDLQMLPGIGANPLWASLYTGLPPQEHGRFHHQQLEDGAYSTHTTHQTDSLAPPVWATLARQGHKVVILDLPKSPPAAGAESSYVANWRSHFSYHDELTTHPEQLIEELTGAGLSPALCPCLTQRFTSSTCHDINSLLESLEEQISASRDLILNRAEKYDWDLLIAGLGAGHCAGHQLWHCHDSNYPGHSGTNEGSPLNEIYRAIDQAVGEIISALPAETTLLVFAGPGMGPSHVHPALMGELLDLLEPSESPGPGTLRKRLTQVWRQLPARWRQRLLRAGHWADQRLQQADYSHRPCFPVLSNDNIGGVRINLQGRETKGTVVPEDYCSYLDHLAKQLASLRNAETGEALVTCIVKTHEDYPGGELGAMPDLLVEWNESAPVRSVCGPEIPKRAVTYPPQWSGAHNQHAMLLMRETRSGSMTPGSVLPANSSVLDIAATLSAACGGAPTIGHGRSLLS